MLSIIIKGFLIGILTSVPVGPIAILCIQRTLNRGRYHGWVTGLGAATSDFVYASLTAFGMGFVIGFINKNQFYLEIIGAVILLIFGCIIFFSNPMKKLAIASPKKESYFQDFITAFALTFTNPLIIFLFMGVFARFDFIDKETTLLMSVVGLFFVFVGAAFWWFLLNVLISLFRSKFNVRGIWLLNKIAGAVLAALAIGGFVFTLTKCAAL
jgi:threonine/homoserine/homoserine lactone efflux protein